ILPPSIAVRFEPLPNVALNKQTVQSSTWNAVGIPFKGVDGCRTEFWGYSCCTHTSTQQNPWWRVDLLAVYKVTAVTIINRQDCCSERLLGAQILIGDSLEQNAGTPTYTFQCNGMEGRYINVIIPGSSKLLTLCEVEVFASLPGKAIRFLSSTSVVAMIAYMTVGKLLPNLETA
uniref:Fucolectin tachylectin-4 pentraxin-1 domain-containing protein n=1 Tax=Oreochromis niloticus TaxID=8128 RepID=A0A669C064_ORENI